MSYVRRRTFDVRRQTSGYPWRRRIEGKGGWFGLSVPTSCLTTVTSRLRCSTGTMSSRVGLQQSARSGHSTLGLSCRRSSVCLSQLLTSARSDDRVQVHLPTCRCQDRAFFRNTENISICGRSKDAASVTDITAAAGGWSSYKCTLRDS